jgi:hypothetical protein
LSNIHIQRVVQNIRSGTTVYTPVIELIVNAIQAITEAGVEKGEICVRILRSGQLDFIEKLRAVDGFSVSDNGVGFTSKNRDAFDTLYTANKADQGGKGFGRFTCLKYFENVAIDSTFKEAGTTKRRTFSMGVEQDIIINEAVETIADRPTGSVVTISGVRAVKFSDKSLDVIARVLVERLLPYLVDKRTKCPKIIVEDEDTEDPVVLNEYLSAANRQIEELEVRPASFVLPRPGGVETFDVRVFKIYAPRAQRSKIALVAHRREVTEVTIQTYIPEFADEFYEPGSEGQGRNFIVKAYVYGNFLDDNVSLERGAFEFGREADLIYGLSQVQIEAGASEIARETMGEEISTRRGRKAQRVRDYVTEDAPWHAGVLDDSDLSSLPMNPSKLDIELHLQRDKYTRDIKVRRDVAAILENADAAGLGARVAEVAAGISQSSKNDLIHYVSMRKCVLDLFERSLALDATGKHRSEGNVHDIIIPRGRDSDDLDYSQHNLWILDERLNFTSFLSSDKPINGPKSDRTDLTVFNRPIAFRGDNEPSNPITIFEFKRPQRDDFVGRSSEDPVQQIVRYVNSFRDGKFKTPEGRNIRVAETTTFYGYVVCDLTPKVENWLEREKNFTRMPDGLGWFWWYGNIKLYIEVLAWEKVLKDAAMRNKVFFHQLGI